MTNKEIADAIEELHSRQRRYVAAYYPDKDVMSMPLIEVMLLYQRMEEELKEQAEQENSCLHEEFIYKNPDIISTESRKKVIVEFDVCCSDCNKHLYYERQLYKYKRKI